MMNTGTIRSFVSGSTVSGSTVLILIHLDHCCSFPSPVVSLRRGFAAFFHCGCVGDIALAVNFTRR